MRSAGTHWHAGYNIAANQESLQPMSPSGLTPEQNARQTIDANLRAAGWSVQDRQRSLADSRRGTPAPGVTDLGELPTAR